MCSPKKIILAGLAATIFLGCFSLLQANNKTQPDSLSQEPVSCTEHQDEYQQLKSLLRDNELEKALTPSFYDRWAKEIWAGAGTVSTLAIVLLAATIKKAYASNVPTTEPKPIETQQQASLPSPSRAAPEETPSTENPREIDNDDDAEILQAQLLEEQYEAELEAALEQSKDEETERQRVAQEKARQEEIEAEEQRAAEQERAEQQRLAQEKARQEDAERQRRLVQLMREAAEFRRDVERKQNEEAARLEAERKRLETERLERERKQKEEANRLAAELQKQHEAALAKQREEAASAEAERKRLDAEHLERELLRLQAEKRKKAAAERRRKRNEVPLRTMVLRSDDRKEERESRDHKEEPVAHELRNGKRY